MAVVFFSGNTLVRAAAAALVVMLAAPAARAQNAEGVAFARANTCASLRSFLTQYPNGRFAADARAALTVKNCPDPEAEARRLEEQRAREARELRDSLAREKAARIAAEQRAADEARKRREAEDAARRAAIVTPQDQELARLASIRGDWIQSWLNAETAPGYFTTGYFIIGASTKTGGWMTSSSYPCGGAIVRGSRWSKPTAASSMSFELVYGRLPSGLTSVTHSFYHSRTTYLGPSWSDAWRAVSEAAYSKSGQSCGSVQDRRSLLAPPPPASVPPAPATTSSSTVSSELTRLANIRGDWMRGWEDSETAPSFFRSGYFIVGSLQKGGGWETGGGYPCGGAIVRGNTWRKRSSPTSQALQVFELQYGRMPTGSTTVTGSFFGTRASYLGATWNDAWRATSEAAYRASGQSCGALQDRRSSPGLTAPPPPPKTSLSVRERVQGSITGTWRRVSGPCTSPLNRFSFPNGQLSWKFTTSSAPSTWSDMSASGWTTLYENNQMIIVSGGGASRTTIGLEGANLVWRSNGNIHCTMTRDTTTL